MNERCPGAAGRRGRVHSCHDPGLLFDVTGTEPKLGDRVVLLHFHHHTRSGLTLRTSCLAAEPRRRHSKLPLEGAIE